jgi:hypothetical protein
MEGTEVKREEMPKRWKEGQATGPLALPIEDFVSGHFKRIKTMALRL